MDGLLPIEVALVEVALVGAALGPVLLVIVLLIEVVVLVGKASHFLWCLLYHQKIGLK